MACVEWPGTMNNRPKGKNAETINTLTQILAVQTQCIVSVPENSEKL